MLYCQRDEQLESLPLIRLALSSPTSATLPQSQKRGTGQAQHWGFQYKGLTTRESPMSLSRPLIELGCSFLTPWVRALCLVVTLPTYLSRADRRRDRPFCAAQQSRRPMFQKHQNTHAMAFSTRYLTAWALPQSSHLLIWQPANFRSAAQRPAFHVCGRGALLNTHPANASSVAIYTDI